MVNSVFGRATVGNRFYNNRVEVLSKLQKKFVVEDLRCTQSNACIINQELQQWTDFYYREVTKAIYGHGKYRLAPGYEIFYKEPTQWFKLSEE